MKICHTSFLALVLLLVGTRSGQAWDYEGHRLVNQLAIAALPTNFPAFIRTTNAMERVAFLAGEPDRWRNTNEQLLRHANAPEHYFDMEDLDDYGLKPANVPTFRHEFTALLASTRTTNNAPLKGYESRSDPDRVKLLVGLLPWSIAENYAKLKSGFSYLKAYEESGTPEEVRNAQENLIYIMGVMGHYVGDAAQPLHMTKHYNGWVGENPKGFTTNKTFHAWIDGGFIQKAGINFDSLKSKVTPALPLWGPGTEKKKEPIIKSVMSYLEAQFTKVEPLYQMEKDGKLSGKGTVGLEGKDFIAGQLLTGSQMLASIWLTAWQEAPPDGYLKAYLQRRKKEADATSKP